MIKNDKARHDEFRVGDPGATIVVDPRTTFALKSRR